MSGGGGLERTVFVTKYTLNAVSFLSITSNAELRRHVAKYVSAASLAVPHLPAQAARYARNLLAIRLAGLTVTSADVTWPQDR